MSQSESRRKRRAVKSGANRDVKKAKQQGKVLATKFELDALQDAMNKALQQLSGNQEQFGKNLNQNLGAIRAAFEFSDAHFHVYRAVMDDYVMGNIRIKKLEDGTVTGVDWDWYYGQYSEMLKAKAAEAEAKKEEEDSEKEAEESPEPPAEDFVFGGDYADTNDQEGQESPGDEQGHREELDGGRDEADAVREVRPDGGADAGV